MARVYEPTKAQRGAWAKWLKSRPKNVRAVAEKLPPWNLYQLEDTSQLVTIASFQEAEDGSVTVTVNVTGEYNSVLFDRRVFGVDPTNLREAELPTDDEVLGAVLSNEEVRENFDVIRVLIRPDLWVLDEAGKAVRKQ